MAVRANESGKRKSLVRRIQSQVNEGQMEDGKSQIANRARELQ
jgi:hypothetical protein